MTNSGFDVIVCGSLHLDVMVKASHLPRLDETAVGSAWGMACGGKGGNQAVMAAKMGARTAMIGRVGKDDFGQQLLKNLGHASVDYTGVGTDNDAGSGMSVAIVDSHGDYGAVIVSGANLKMDPDECAGQWKKRGGAKILVLQNEIPEAVNVAVAKVARASGATVMLNAAPARKMGQEFLKYIDILVVNRVEAEMMAGTPVADSKTAELALPALGAGTRDVIITLGGEGLVLQGRDGTPVYLAPQPVKVVSTHGAGDCFLGALATQLAAGSTLVEACEFANRTAAHYVGLDETARATFKRSL
jgi:ribokinase